MTTYLKPFLVRETLLNQDTRIFTPLEFQRIFMRSKEEIKYFLEKGVREGLFWRLKKGFYALKTDLPSEEKIANKIYQPSYLSFEYALAKCNILPEMVYQITSATTKPTRLFEVEGKIFSYFTIKREAYTGYSLQNGVLLAEPEKALVDYLYFVSLGKKPVNDRLDFSKLDKEKIINYAKLFGRPSVITLVKSI